MIRAFICLPVPEYFLSVHQDMIKRASVGYYPMMQPKEKGHLTLQFLGDITSEQVIKVNKILKIIAHKHQSIKITANKFSIISKGPYNLVVINIKKTKELLNLKNDISRNLMTDRVCKRDNKEYYPHITLAKLPKRIIKYDDLSIKKISYISSSIKLVKSTLLLNGSRFNVLGSYMFQNAQG